GLGSDEFAAVLQKGERVLTQDQTAKSLGVISGLADRGGGGRQEVNIYNNSGAEVSQQRRSSGGREIVDIVIGAVNKGIGQGKLNKSMSGQFGVKPVPRQR